MTRRLRSLALSYWTPVLVGLALLGVHLAWAIRWEPARRGEVVTGFGAAMIVLGLFVAARPYIRLGLGPFIRGALTPDVGTFVTDDSYDEQLKAIHAAELPEVTRDAWAERVIAVAVIAAGTILNGYGPLLVRLFGWEVQQP